MASQLRLILDDNAQDFVYSGGSWTLSTLVQWYSQTSNYPAFVSATVFGSFTLQFEGTQIAFIGNTPTPDFSQYAIITIDGGTPVNTTYGDLPPPAYVQWYQSPTLSDGNHTIEVEHLAGTAVDMAIITVGPNTSLLKKKVFVDDRDVVIQYSGSWVEDTGGFNAGTLPDGFPIGKTTHRSSTPGDTVTFRFTGTSIALYGIFSWTNLGLLSATYKLDGNTIPQSYPVTGSSPQYLQTYGEASNFVFYSNDTIPAGDHTLVMEITACENITFILDYITYSPSFLTLAAMPNLTTVTPALSSASSSHTATTLPSGFSAVPQASAGAKKAPIGAIVGAAVGGLFLIGLAIALLYLLRRKRRPLEESEGVHPFEAKINDQYLPPQAPALSSSRQNNPSASSNDSLTPFPTTSPPHTFSSMANLKRARGDNNLVSQGLMSEPRSSTNELSAAGAAHSGSYFGSENTDPLEYISESGPPAYDALSPHP